MSAPDTKRSRLIRLLNVFFASWAAMLLGGMQVRNVLIVPLSVALYLFFRHTERVGARNAAALIYTLLTLFATWDTLTGPFSSALFRVLTLVVTAAGLFAFLRRFLPWLSDALNGWQGSAFRFGGVRHPFLMVFLVLILCWLPYYLYEFPGICSPDSIVQLEQVTGLKPYSNHHPVVHTLLIRAFYSAGTGLFSSPNAGLACYTAAQMLFLACACTFLIQTVYRLPLPEGKRDVLTLSGILFFALLPVHGVYAVAVWKDIPFTAVMMIFTSLLTRTVVIEDGDTPVSLIRAAGLFITSFAVCTLRTNGLYLFLFFLPFAVVFFVRRRKKQCLYAVVCVAAMIPALILRGPVLERAHIPQPDLVESLCVPVQQLSRVIVKDGRISDADREELSKVMDLSYVKEYYAEDFADNIKELIRAGDEEYLASHKLTFFLLWLRTGLRNPGHYLQAWIALTKGFWFPDMVYHTAWIDGIIDNAVGVYHAPLIGGRVVIKCKELLLKAGEFVPFYGLFFSMGFYTWTLIFAAFHLHGQKERPAGALFVFLPSALLFVTLLLATPVATEFRYAYPVVMTSPLLISVALVTPYEARGKGKEAV